MLCHGAARGQHICDQRPVAVAGLADEEDEHDHPDAPVDDLENMQDRVLRLVRMDPVHEERGTLQIGMISSLLPPITHNKTSFSCKIEKF